jgi:uncharacterized protein YbaP (TraB family)
VAAIEPMAERIMREVGMVRRVRILLLWIPLWGVAQAAAPLHTFWSVKGEHNTVYLLGSVHVLKPADSDLPPEALRAYDGAGALVMELDLNNLDAGQVAGLGPELETLPAGETLEHVLGSRAYARFLEHAKPLGLDPELFSHYQPWFVAVSLEQLELMRLGFEAGSGVDEQFAQRAQSDHKPIVALETLEDQLGLFAHLSLDQQRRFLLYTLEDSEDAAKEVDAVVDAWRHGDTAALERLLGDSYQEFPELFRLLTTDRNRRWLPTLVGLLHGTQDYMVIVGALHLVGKDGIVALLRQAGYEVVQH